MIFQNSFNSYGLLSCKSRANITAGSLLNKHSDFIVKEEGVSHLEDGRAIGSCYKYPWFKATQLSSAEELSSNRRM